MVNLVFAIMILYFPIRVVAEASARILEREKMIAIGPDQIKRAEFWTRILGFVVVFMWVVGVAFWTLLAYGIITKIMG